MTRNPIYLCFLLLFSAQGAFAAELTAIANGQPAAVHYIGAPWTQGDGRLSSVGDTSRLYANQAIGTGNFHITARLALPTMKHQAPEIGIGPYSYFQFDANGGRYIIGGPLLVTDEQMIRYSIVGRNAEHVTPGEPFTFEAIGADGQIEFRINGTSIHTTPLLRPEIGPVSLFPATGSLDVFDLRVEAEELHPYQAEGVTAYGVSLDPRLTWRPDLRKANYVKLADGSLAYLTGLDLMISRDGGLTFERRKGTIESDAWSDTLQFSGAMLLRTTENTLIGITINNKNYRHLDWDDETNSSLGGTREVWAIRSTDEGHTWTDVQRIYDGYCGALVDMIQTSSGHIVVPVQELYDAQHRHITRTYVSADDGLTWLPGNTLDIGGRGNYDGAFEPTLAELDGGRLLMLMRTNLDYLWAAYSDTAGRYWRETRPSGFDASSSPPFMRRLDSGRIVLVWNRVYPEGKESYRRRVGKWSETPVSWHREEVSLAITDASGERWSDPVVIARKPGLWMAYPYVFEPSPGVVWVFASGGLVAEFREEDFVNEGP